jgi:hypothetical protein
MAVLNTTGARGYILPPTTAPGNPGEGELLPGTLAKLDTLGFAIRELAVDGGFGKHTTQDAAGAEGRISHLKTYEPSRFPG